MRDLAEKLAVPIFVQAFKTEKYASDQQLSIQLACRKLRYQWFRELCAAESFDYILTAHHANDSLETFLINTTRGTGLDGLTGIPAQNGNIVRPLLPFTRKEIEAYAEQSRIEWREDASNTSDKYFRNKIRHHVIPVLEEENLKLISNFAEQTQPHLQDAAALLEDYTALLFSRIVTQKEGDYYLNITELKKVPHPKAVLYQLLKDFGFAQWNDVTHLLVAQTGKQVFSETHRLLKDRDFLILTENKKTSIKTFSIQEKDSKLTFNAGVLRIERGVEMHAKTKEIAYLSAEEITFPLTVRKWKAGDFFYPLGMKGKKKISDFLKDEKCSRIEKDQTWVMLSEGKIVWVIGHRIDERFKIKTNQQTIIKITLFQ